eukprot:Gb_39622 [translate_table: standard]
MEPSTLQSSDQLGCDCAEEIMLNTRETHGGEVRSSRQGLGIGKIVLENLCCNSFKGGSVAIVSIMVFYLFSQILSKNSSQCLDARLLESNVGHINAHDLHQSGSDNNYISNSSIEPTSLDHVVFGIAASAERWKERKDYIDLWWQPGKTRGFVWLDFPTKEPWPPSSPPYRISEDTSRFNYSNPEGSRSAIRIARIVSETFRLGLPNVRWFVMGDDDTLFFTDNLLQVLSKYDYNQYYYIGSNSESTQQNVDHSYAMAFGGGGFAISYPLAKALEKIQDECLTRYENLYGSDHRIQACLAELGVPVTKEPGFHQVDLHGDLYGLLVAHPIAPLISLHHLDSVAPIFPKMTRVDALQHLMEPARIDPGRVLQQSICYDKRRNWTISISWGYSVQIYDTIQLPNLLQYPLQTFATWTYSNMYPFMFNTRPFPENPCKGPAILFMDNVKYNSSQVQVVSNYARQDTYLSPQKCHVRKDYSLNKVHCIRVLSDKMSPHIWTQAPRRQCCDVLSSSGKDFMEINIRSCRDEEAIFQPS